MTEFPPFRPVLANFGQPSPRMGPKGKAPSSKVTAGDVGCYNKGRHNEGTGQQEQRWFLRTKKKIGGKNGKKATSFCPNYVGPPENRLVKGFNGVWDSEEGARGGVDDFVLYLNGSLEVRVERPRAAKTATATPTKMEMKGHEEPSLELVLKRKRAAMKETTASKQRADLHTALGKAHRGSVNIDLTERLAGMVRKDACPSELAGIISAIGSDAAAARKADNKRRAEATKAERPRKRSEPTSCVRDKAYKLRLKVRKWRKAVKFLDPFIKAQTTGGLVLAAEGIDLSSTGNERILKKAMIVRVYCQERINGATAEEANESCTRLYPKDDRMSSTRSVCRYLQQFFVNWGFHETSAGRYVRECIWDNPSLVYAMKVFIRKNMYSVVKDASDGVRKICRLSTRSGPFE